MRKHDFNFRSAWKLAVENRNYAYISFIIMVLSGMLGYIFPDFMGEVQDEALERILSQIPTDSPASTSLFIIQNNLKASFVGMALGILVVVPFIMLAANGFLVGAVMHRAADTFGPGVVLRLVPHGIFEIPAICISTGFGIRIAAGIFKKESLWENYRQAFIVFIFIVLPLILVAGTIEGILFYLFH